MPVLPRAIGFVLAVFPLVPAATADEGPLRIDHKLSLDQDGPWRTRNQRAVLGAAGLAVGATALWNGADTRVGKTAWQALDAAAVGGASAEGLKRVFGRERPTQTDDPNRWFKGNSNRSFPSGEATVMAALVTPFVLEYRNEYPAAYALELLPAFTAIARLRVQAHWQTDVLAGLALGAAAGYAAHSLAEPVSVMILPRAITVGLKMKF